MPTERARVSQITMEIATEIATEDYASRVLVLAPIGRDSALACQMLLQAGIEARACADLWHLWREAEAGVGLVVLTDEAWTDETAEGFRRFREKEPSWSDLPVVFVVSERNRAAGYMGVLGNVTLLDRPLRIAVFVAAVRAALQSRKRQYEVRDLLDQIAWTQQQQRALLSDILAAVTRGKLRLCSPEELLPAPAPPLWSLPLRGLEDVPRLRERLKSAERPQEIGPERWYDFLVASGEAATNAIKHGHGGHAALFISEDRISLRIEDNGPGIALEDLPRATLQPGYSSARSLGMGFTAIVEFVDAVTLATNVNGTIITLELRRSASPDDFLAQLMASYEA